MEIENVFMVTKIQPQIKDMEVENVFMVTKISQQSVEEKRITFKASKNDVWKSPWSY